MKAFLALLGVNFKSLLLTTAGLGRKNRKKAASGVSALVFLSVLMLYISGIFSFMLASQLAPLDLLDLMLPIIAIMALAFPLMLTIFSAQSMIFSTKDVDLVLSLPVSSFSVMLSRVLALYLEVLLMVEMLLLPAGVAWHWYGGGGFVLPILIVEGVFLALLPTTLAFVFGCLISLLVSRLRFKNLFTALFSIVLFGAIMVASFTFSFSMQNVAGMSADLRGMLESSLGPALWVTNIAVHTDIPGLLLLILACTLPFLAIAWVFSRFFKSLLTHLSSFKLTSNYKLGRLNATGSLAALMKKEARKFFGTPVYLMNSGMGAIMAIGLAVFAAFKRADIQQMFLSLWELEGGDAVLAYIPPILLAILAFLTLMLNPTSSTISLEGKTLWILKEAPLSTGRIFLAKAGFNFLLILAMLAIVMPLAGYAFSLSPLTTLLMSLLMLLYGAIISMLGLYINLSFPRMDAENDTIVIKQSASVIYSMLGALAVAAPVVVLYLLMNHAGIHFNLFALAGSAFLAFLAAGLLALLRTSGRKKFEAL